MSQSYIKLNPKQCWSLLSSIVDCDPDLYNLIKDCSKQYTDNPELYEIETNITNWLYKNIISPHQCEGIHIDHFEFNKYKVSWYNDITHDDYSCLIEYIDEHNINRL